jgi:hypothetical protein
MCPFPLRDHGTGTSSTQSREREPYVFFSAEGSRDRHFEYSEPVPVSSGRFQIRPRPCGARSYSPKTSFMLRSFSLLMWTASMFLVADATDLFAQRLVLVVELAGVKPARVLGERGYRKIGLGVCTSELARDSGGESGFRTGLVRSPGECRAVVWPTREFRSCAIR